ncbi:Hypothetical_protein [Hexamita inflata]|uniref:Hypothetical_protein n=1 Tax=Hexamita inflata TaxID=28002 RepID=A0AA86NWG3_9EUKA|nr:Hypothetical protein HINF_LOCUS14137 [Hexamita inflata]
MLHDNLQATTFIIIIVRIILFRTYTWIFIVCQEVLQQLSAVRCSPVNITIVGLRRFSTDWNLVTLINSAKCNFSNYSFNVFRHNYTIFGKLGNITNYKPPTPWWYKRKLKKSLFTYLNQTVKQIFEVHGRNRHIGWESTD